VVAVAVVVIGGFTVIGATLPRNHVVSRTAHLSAPPDTVWSLITNVAGYPAWRKDVRKVEQLQAAPRLRWRESYSHDKLTFEAIKAEPPVNFVSTIVDEGQGFGGRWDYQISPDGTGSTITIAEFGEVSNPLFRFISQYVMGHTATLDKYLNSLAARTGDTYNPGAAQIVQSPLRK
jgi:uncharacterized protein YndB with AHSA1/START domain